MNAVRRCRCGKPPAFEASRPGKTIVLCKVCGNGRTLRNLVLAHGYTVRRAAEQEARL